MLKVHKIYLNLNRFLTSFMRSTQVSRRPTKCNWSAQKQNEIRENLEAFFFRNSAHKQFLCKWKIQGNTASMHGQFRNYNHQTSFFSPRYRDVWRVFRICQTALIGENNGWRDSIIKILFYFFAVFVCCRIVVHYVTVRKTSFIFIMNTLLRININDSKKRKKITYTKQLHVCNCEVLFLHVS